MGCTTSGHWARGCRGADRTGKAASSPAGEDTGGGRETATRAILRGRKVSDFLWGGGRVCLPESIHLGPGPCPSLPLQQAVPPTPFLEVGQSDLRVRPFAGSSGGGSYTPRGEKGAPEEGGGSG